MTLTKGFVRNAATTPLDTRLMDQALVVQNADGSARAGVLTTNPSIVTTTATTSPMTVQVAAAEFIATKGKADGVTRPTNDGPAAVTITAAPASNSRITVIWVKHNDDTTGDANALPVFGTTDGATAASPTKPAIPTGALELATLRVYAGTTASNGGSNALVNTYAMTAFDGDAPAFRTKADLLLWTTAKEGQKALVLDTMIVARYTGGSWIPWESPDITYTPTFTNLTVGTGALSASYRFREGMCIVEGSFTLGSGSAIGTFPRITHPVATALARQGISGFELGRAGFEDVGTAGLKGFVTAFSTSVAEFRTMQVVGSYVAHGGVASTSPFTWTTGDILTWRYEFTPATW